MRCCTCVACLERVPAQRSGTRSRLIRGSTSNGHVWCTASDGRGTPARPASHVWNASVDVLRRTRRNSHTIRGAAPVLTIGRPAAHRAGARPYQLTFILDSSELLGQRERTTVRENSAPSPNGGLCLQRLRRQASAYAGGKGWSLRLQLQRQRLEPSLTTAEAKAGAFAYNSLLTSR